MAEFEGDPVARTHDELIERAYQELRALMRAQQALSAPLWAELDLSVAQLKALFALATEGPATIGQVADALSISLPTASHLVERLVQAGLVERLEDPRDRRRALARLTPPAEELTGRLFGCAHRVRAWLGELEADDLAALSQGLGALLRVAATHSALPTATEKGSPRRATALPTRQNATDGQMASRTMRG